jgi:hypothetical protein
MKMITIAIKKSSVWGFMFLLTTVSTIFTCMVSFFLLVNGNMIKSFMVG